MRNQNLKWIGTGIWIAIAVVLAIGSTSRGQTRQRPQPPAVPAAPAAPAARATPSPAPAVAPAAENAAPLPDPATIAASAGFVDLAGIKIGMTEQAAVAALKADNAAFDDQNMLVLRLASQADIARGNRQSGAVMTITATAPVGGTPATPAPAASPRGARAAAPAPAAPAPAAAAPAAPTEIESIVLQFTAPPSQGFIWMGTRTLVFTPAQAPLVENVVAGLRQKYGTESTTRANMLLWFFDAQNKLVPTAQATTLLQTPGAISDCSTGSERSVVIGGNLETAILAFSRNPARAAATDATGACRDFTIVSANVGPMQPGTRLRSLSVVVENHRLIRSSNAAFAAYAQKTNQQQGTQQGIPKL